MKQPPHQVREHVVSPRKSILSQRNIWKGKKRLHQNRLLKKCNTSKRHMERTKKLHQNWLLIRLPQNMHYWLMKHPPHQVRNMLLHPPKVSKVKEISRNVKKLHQNWLLIRLPQNMHYWLMKQPPHQVRNMLLHPPKYLKSKKYRERQKSCTKTGCSSDCHKTCTIG